MRTVGKWFFKYVIYYLVLLLRKEWVWSYKSFLSRSQYQSYQSLKNYQFEKLNNLLQASKCSKFYRSRGYPNYLESWEQLNNIPLLSKDDLRKYGGDMLTAKSGLFCTSKTSGGSTGAPVKVKKPSHAMAKEYAAHWRGYSWAGVDIGELQVRFWGVPLEGKARLRAMLVDLVARRIRFSAFKFKEADLDDHIKKLKNKKKFYFYGYTSMIHEMAVRVIENKVQGLEPKAIIVTSEVLTEASRETMKQAFGCQVYNEYGCGEVGTIAHECEYGEMHINMENVLVEILDEQGHPVRNGEVGEVTVTDLNNNLQPLIRYSLKDFGSVSYRKCPCGRNLQILKNLKGRAYDFIRNEKGEKFHGEFFLYIIENLSRLGHIIDRIQFVRNTDDLTVYFSSSDEARLDIEHYIANKLLKEFSAAIPIKFKDGNVISRESSGKLRVIKNNV